jgi:hypothetical protein
VLPLTGAVSKAFFMPGNLKETNMESEQEYSTTDMLTIGLFMQFGLAPIRKGIDGKMLTYYFNLDAARFVLDMLKEPDCEGIKNYMETVKAVRGEMAAVRSTARIRQK